ncbi:MAG: hypothetical protein F7C07_01045 [Desulfurococcales archaeon]|nr:hypothetical protein [Desulfurococcales archaeon]
MSERQSGLEALAGALESLSDEDVRYIAEALKKIDVRALADALVELSRNADALVEAVRLFKALKDSGALATIEGLLEIGDELFNAAARPEIMKSLGNMMMLVYMLSLFDNALMMKMAEAVPKCVQESVKTMEETEKGMGLRDLLSLMRSPEMAALLNAMVAMSRCIRSGKS